MRDEMVKYISSEEIQEMVKGIAKQIDMDYEGKELVMLCPLRGSIHFLADLMRAITLPQQVDFVHVSTTEKGGAIKIIKDISINISGKHVIIVEEIIDTARTLSFLKNRLYASSPASLKIATLLDKPARRELPIKPDYVGRTIEDRYVVGYGMDSEETGRNYPDIYYFAN
ncbi:MAG: hypoxanthine phosphoribosyltransferase [Pseudobdellovibrionaceae bacterium]